jgi:hypothetical protein
VGSPSEQNIAALVLIRTGVPAEIAEYRKHGRDAHGTSLGKRQRHGFRHAFAIHIN